MKELEETIKKFKTTENYIKIAIHILKDRIIDLERICNIQKVCIVMLILALLICVSLHF